MADDKDLLPEQKAREKIDRMLQDAGWTVVSRKERTDRINSIAVKEELLIGNLEADYYLYLDGKAIGVLEAKRAENPLEEDVQLQAEKYTKQIPNDIPVWCKPLPFAYISNGEVIKFKDLRKEDTEFEDVKDNKIHDLVLAYFVATSFFYKTDILELAYTTKETAYT